MIISIVGTNGMLSTVFSKYFNQFDDVVLNVYGVEEPKGYEYDNYIYTDLLVGSIDFELLIHSDIILYTCGAGVQAALNTPSDLMYKLNLLTPITICNRLKELTYKGVYVSFGSYMEVGVNDDEDMVFNEDEIELSSLMVTNDYALSKRLLTRFMGSFNANFDYLHFILPNLFVENEEGTRLIPYVLNYLKSVKSGAVCDPLSFSAGSQIRQYVNLEEVCALVFDAAKSHIKSGIYNIGGGEILTIKELITRLFDYYNIPVSEAMFGNEIRRDGDIKCLKIDGSKLLSAIGYLPVTKIESIL